MTVKRTKRQQAGIMKQVIFVGTAESLATSYGKPELAALLRTFGQEILEGTLTYDPDRMQRERIINDGSEDEGLG